MNIMMIRIQMLRCKKLYQVNSICTSISMFVTGVKFITNDTKFNIFGNNIIGRHGFISVKSCTNCTDVIRGYSTKSTKDDDEEEEDEEEDEIFDLSKFVKNIERVAKETVENIKKIGPDKSDSLHTIMLKISGSEYYLSDLAQIVTKTPTLAHLHVYDNTLTLKVLRALQTYDNTIQGEVLGSDKIILRLPKHQTGDKVKDLVNSVRRVHQIGANRIDVIRRRGQKYIDKVQGDAKWRRQNSAILKEAVDKANSTLSKLAKEVISTY